MRVVWLTWSFLSCLSAMLCGWGCLLPYWLRGSFFYDAKESFSDLGLFRRCVYPVRSLKESVRVISDCGYYEFDDVPHVYWKISLVLIALSSCILFFITFLLFILGFCLDLLTAGVVHRSCQICQFCAGLLVLTSCILYPMGWHSNTEVIQICGQAASITSLGRCHVGWAFVLTCAGGLLALLSTTIPGLLLKNSCNSSRNDIGSSIRHRAPCVTRANTRCSTDVSPSRPPSQQVTTGTRYSYVSYQSLLAPHSLKSDYRASIPQTEDYNYRHSAYMHPTHRVVINGQPAQLLPSSALSDTNKSNRSTTSSKEHDL